MLFLIQLITTHAGTGRKQHEHRQDKKDVVRGEVFANRVPQVQKEV